jgi:hypothetical protein
VNFNHIHPLWRKPLHQTFKENSARILEFKKAKPWQRILRAPYLVRAPYYSQSSAKGAALGRGLGKSGKARSINTFANHQKEVNH